MRIPFLILAPVSVFCGYAAARLAGFSPRGIDVAVLVVAAVLAHIGVNALNEYHDYRSGLDASTRRTPFSGGSGALPAAGGSGAPALRVAFLSIVGAVLMGGWFVLRGRTLVLPFGIAGILIVVLYTPTVLRSPVAGLAAPGLGFGPCIVLGTEAALTGAISGRGVLLSFVPLFLVSGLLLVNQYPDIGPDRAVGRRTTPIAYGERAGLHIYGLLLAAAFLSIALSVAIRVMPFPALLGLLTVPVGVWAYRASLVRYPSPARYIPVMAANVLIVLLTPALMSLGVLLV